MFKRSTQLLTKTSYHFLSRRWHVTEHLTGTISNDHGRLRHQEEKYCNSISTPFKQPYKDTLEALSQATTSRYTKAFMMIPEAQAKLMHQLVGLLRPRRILEIGGFTGYSAIAMASALAPGGKLLSLELDQTHIETAKEFVEMTDLRDKIELKQGPAQESLDDLCSNAKTEFDLIFMDADKGGYISYYETILKHNLLSDHGVLIVDNVLFFGQVHKEAGYGDGNDGFEATKNLKKTALKLHKFNQHVANDPRVEVVVLPLFDGLSIIRKK